MAPIEVVYENGVLRPLYPLDLEEGTRLEATLTPMAPAPGAGADETVDEAAYLAFVNELERIAALPPEGPPQPHAARDHDAILYPKEGPMP